jgi:hypothetical protein
MRPFTVLIGIVLGSAASMTFGLIAVLVVFLILKGEHPEIGREMSTLTGMLAATALLTTASASSFLGEVKDRPWRGWAHVATFVCLCGLVLLYWPKRV